MRENRKTAGRRTVCLLLAFALLLGVLPIRAFAQSDVDTVVQALQRFSASIGNRLIIESSDSTVTVTATQDWVSFDGQTLFLTIPEGVTVDWKATVVNSTRNTLIQMSEESRGTLRLTAGGKIAAGNSGSGIEVLGGNFELSGGEIDAGERDARGIWVQGSNSRFTCSSGTVIVGSFAQGLRISNGGTAEINGGQISCSQSGAQAILMEGRSKLTISGGNIVLRDTGKALQISNGGTVEIKGGKIWCNQSGAQAIVMDKASLTISDGLVRCDAEDTIALSNQSAVTISGGMIRNAGEGSGKFVLNASADSFVTVTGGSIKGKIHGLTDVNLKNNADAPVYPVYKVTLEGLQSAESTTVELLSPQGYGVSGIDLGTDEKLYFYLPAGETEFKLKVGSKTYYGKADVQANHDNTVPMTDKFIEITEQPQSVTKTYAPDLEITLRVRATCENPITYQWYSKPDGAGNFTAIPNATSSTLTLRGLNAGNTSYYCLLNAEGAIEVRTEESVVEIASATYTGTTTGNIYVKSGQVTENVTYTLPTLPQGLRWESPGLQLGQSLIENPRLSGNVLSFKTNDRPTGTSTTITVGTNVNDNYFSINFVLTVTAQEKTVVQITGLTAEDAMYDGQSHRGFTGTAQTQPNYTGTLEYKYEGRAGTNYPVNTNPPTNAGEYKVTISVPSTDSEYIGSVSLDFAIAKRKVRVKADNKSMIAGQNLPPFTYTVIGQVNGETALNGAPHLSVATDGKTPGTFDIDVNMTGVTYTDNYEADNPASEKGMLAVQSPARYRISVNPTEWDFGRVLQNELPTEKEFVIRNTGNQTLRSLKLSLSGKNAEMFELSETQIERLNVRKEYAITVTPKRDLPVGRYQATLEINGSRRISKKIPLQFEVISLPIEGSYKKWETKTEVPLEKKWNILFNRKLDKASVSDGNVFLVSAEDPSTKISANIRLSEDGMTIHIQPKQPLNGQKKYFLIIQMIKDERGNLLKENVVMPFKTV